MLRAPGALQGACVECFREHDREDKMQVWVNGALPLALATESGRTIRLLNMTGNSTHFLTLVRLGPKPNASCPGVFLEQFLVSSLCRNTKEAQDEASLQISGRRY